MRCRAHPRVGGENRHRCHELLDGLGSSPRGRGKPVGKGLGFGARGLIPAWAGKTNIHVTALVTNPAHPRVGGENAPIVSVLPFSQGSSPRGRGKPQQLVSNGQLGRLIPAWAGKTRR